MTSTVDISAHHGDDTLSDSDTIAATETAESVTPPDSDANQDTGSAMTQAEREAEYYTIAWVSPTTLEIGPNVRTENARPDADTVKDVKKRGIRTPIHAYRDEAGQLVVTLGQLRTLGAIEAGRDQVMVLIEPPPTEDEKQADIDRIVDQLNENDMRKAMTRGDIYKAHKQLELLGLSAAAIARRRSRRKQVVEDSLRVGDSELASKAADKYALNLEQAAVVAEFEGNDDLDAAKQLITTAVEHPNNFRVLAQKLRNDRAEAERVRQTTEKIRAELTEAGVRILDGSISQWNGEARSLDRLRATPDAEPGTEIGVEAHAECPGHSAWIVEEYDEDDNLIIAPSYGCADFRAHGHALLNAPSGQIESSFSSAVAGATSPASVPDTASDELEREKKRITNRWVRENNKLWDAAAETRREWLAQFINRKKAPQGAQTWLATQKLKGHIEIRRAMERGYWLAHELLKLPSPAFGHATLEDKIAKATAVKATLYDVFLTLTAMEEGLDRDSWRRPMGADADYMSTIISWGYSASDVERKVLAPERAEAVVAAAMGEPSETDDEPGDVTEAAPQSDDGGDDDGSTDVSAGADVATGEESGLDTPDEGTETEAMTESPEDAEPADGEI